MSERVLLTMKECQKRLGLPRSTTYKLLNGRPGVHRYHTPGSTRPTIRVDAAEIERILAESEDPD